MATKISTNWEGIPSLSTRTTVKEKREVKNARVVYLSKASIRNAVVSGYFKVAEGAEVKTFGGKRRIEVECLWFGCKPPTCWMNITILSTSRFENGYSNTVNWNIAK
jgi:hypothetical protein